MAAGHKGEPELPGTFVDYEAKPREYELSVAQTMLRVHTRVADLYNDPMNQTEQQLRLTIEALRERQEDELVNNREFGLLHNADLQAAHPHPHRAAHARRPRRAALPGVEGRRRSSWPTPAPSPPSAGSATTAASTRSPSPWRAAWCRPGAGFPSSRATRSRSPTPAPARSCCMRIGEENQGVVGLHQTGIPDEYQPSLNVRFMGINEKAIISYLVSAYYSAAVLVPDALAILEDVEIGRYEA